MIRREPTLLLFPLWISLLLGSSCRVANLGGGNGNVDGASPSDAALLGDGAVPDAAAHDAAGSDGAAPDSALHDAAGSDGGAADGAVPDAALPDAALPDAALPDAGVTCPTTPPCPALPGAGYTEVNGLLAIDPCAFPILDQDTWAAQGALLDTLALTLPQRQVADVLADLNRVGSAISVTDLRGGATPNVPGYLWGFAWNAGDLAVDYWIPQGLTGSPDAEASGLVAGRRVALVTWYYDAALDPASPGEKGIRVSLADVTAPASVTYRLLLLVEPYHDGTRVNLRAINIHAGGAVWYGPYLYVADTSVGFRVFDMTRLLQVDTSEDRIGWYSGTGTYHAYGYKYVIPQVGTLRRQSSCSQVFSFVALDRSQSPHRLVSGEYDASLITGRLYRWPLDAVTSRLPSGLSTPSDAFYLGKRQVQGAVSHGAKTYLSSSQPAAGHGELVVTIPGAVLGTVPWVDGPEDLLYDVVNDELWGCGELEPTRYVFAVDPAALP